MALVISGFPAVGKSYFYATASERMLVTVADSDSSQFSWKRPGERHPDFPDNYMRHIKSLLGKRDVVLVSSHKEVRDALVANGIRFALVYPQRAIKEQYLERCCTRGSDNVFVELLDKMWDEWITELQEQPHCRHIELGLDEYLSDVILRAR